MATGSTTSSKRAEHGSSNNGLATHLVALRQQRGLSQAALAEAAGITRRMVVAYEREDASPPARILPALASALGTTIDELFSAKSRKTSMIHRRNHSPRAKTRKREAPASFGARLAELRKKRGMTQPELGEAVGISQRMVTYYETQNGNPPVALIPKFADALGISLDELFGRDDSPPAPPEINLRLWRRFQGIEELTAQQKRAVLEHINGLVRTRSNAD